LSTVFSPDDLALVKGGPAERRNYLDDLLADHDVRAAALIADITRVLKQRNTLLRQAAGRLTPDIASTLDVWDAKFSELGELLIGARQDLVSRLTGHVNSGYATIASSEIGADAIGMRMVSDWQETHGQNGLLEVLRRNRSGDVARGVTSSGPHRDECLLTINGMAARTHASQGEQRTLALALRLAANSLLRESTGVPPVLLLDDVFSELDDQRSTRLLSALPRTQTFVTTATFPPRGWEPAQIVTVSSGRAETSTKAPA
jgi:DNA replication and repair protein RecF